MVINRSFRSAVGGVCAAGLLYGTLAAKHDEYDQPHTHENIDVRPVAVVEAQHITNTAAHVVWSVDQI